MKATINWENGTQDDITFIQYEKMRWQSEEYECIQKVLNDLKAPMNDLNGECLSAVGRIYKLLNK